MSIPLAPGTIFVEEKGHEPVYLGKTPGMIVVGTSGSTEFLSLEASARRFFVSMPWMSAPIMQHARLCGMRHCPLRKSQKTQLRYERFQRNRK